MLFISAKVSAAIIYLDAVLTMVLSGPIHVDLRHKNNINRQKLKKLTFLEEPTSSNTESPHIQKEKMFEMFGPSI